MNTKFLFNFAANIPKKKVSLKSNLQKSILAFYREVLKFCYKKPEVKPTKKFFQTLFSAYQDECVELCKNRI